MKAVGETRVDWKLMDDPANVENRNAGNGGDLVKHTVYLAVLRFLLRQEPWNSGLRLRECHAGRGIYRIPDGDSRRRLLSCLYSKPASAVPVLLHQAQKKILGVLHCWPAAAEQVQWYAGSALINACTLAESPSNGHLMELYEWMPETRQILRSVIAAASPNAEHRWCVCWPQDDRREFDGEKYIAENIGHWGKRDVVFLDPFAMWRQPSDRAKRNRYGVIVDALVRRGPDTPSLILFWTWGRAFPIADGDLDGTAVPVRNGYSELRSNLHKAGLHFVVVKWRWGLQFAMWVLVPSAQVAALREELDNHCHLLSDHLIRRGAGRSMSHPEVQVAVD
jgi:hypothetical protein